MTNFRENEQIVKYYPVHMDKHTRPKTIDRIISYISNQFLFPTQTYRLDKITEKSKKKREETNNKKSLITRIEEKYK